MQSRVPEDVYNDSNGERNKEDSQNEPNCKDVEKNVSAKNSNSESESDSTSDGLWIQENAEDGNDETNGRVTHESEGRVNNETEFNK